jgi:hypothetical protein
MAPEFPLSVAHSHVSSARPTDMQIRHWPCEAAQFCDMPCHGDGVAIHCNWLQSRKSTFMLARILHSSPKFSGAK